MVVELAGAGAGLGIAGTAAGLRKSNKLVGETAEAKKWLDGNSPQPRAETPGEYIIEGAIKQEEALDEVGMYGYMQNPSLDAPIKGIHDAFDYTETGVRTVDDFGVVGAAVDQVRIARNLDTVNVVLVMSSLNLHLSMVSAVVTMHKILYLDWLISLNKLVRSIWKVVTGRYLLKMLLTKVKT